MPLMIFTARAGAIWNGTVNYPIV
ncbi:unnamed protein product [Aspergillus niger]|uniref:Contig An13c0070, genomic contig n=1 Tax=Aspergillus niger (strain ATCC MYA-4892 / CBS 513.88 / FGSC A1513) TaxID=425011 RepID=A2R1R8_ASPNC|nr:unnamed protein product [Aspergillus niger]